MKPNDVGDRMYMGDKLTFGESEEVEFKASFNDGNHYECRRTINAFLNTKGGCLYFGILDDGTIKGVIYKNTIVSQDRFRQWIDDTQQNHFKPSVSTIKVEFFQTFGNDNLRYEAIKCKSEELTFDGRHTDGYLLCIETMIVFLSMTAP